MKLWQIVTTFLLCSSFLPSTPALAQNVIRSVTVGMVTDWPGVLADRSRESMITEIRVLLEGEFEVSFPEAKHYYADGTTDSVEAVLDRLLTDPAVDVIITNGPIASYRAALRTDLAKPTIAPYALDILWQRLPMSGRGSGVHNLNYIVSLPRAARGIRTLHEIVPFSKLALLVLPRYDAAFKDADTTLIKLPSELDCEMVWLITGATAEETVARIPADVDAVYVFPLSFGWPADEIRELSQLLIDRGLPSFSYLGRSEVDLGFLAGLGTIIDFSRLSRRVAINLQRILLGEDASELPVDYSINAQLTINMATARALKTFPDWQVMTEAELLNERSTAGGTPLSLEQTLRSVLTVNQELRASQSEVLAGEGDVGKARAALLPQADVGLTYAVIDDDRAAASFGSQAERTLSGSASLTQILFSDQLWAGLSIEKKLQKQRELAHESLRLDILRDAAVAYLNVLRTLTVERIQKNNLSLSQANLELALARRSIGQSGPGEVYRWDSQIARNRQDVVEAAARRNLAEIELNRLLNREAEASLPVNDSDIDSPDLLINNPRLFKYRNDKWAFRVLRRFLTREGLNNSPVLKQFDELITAQQQRRSAAVRSFFLPTVAARAQLDYIFDESGAGADGFGTSGGFTLPFEEPDDVSWSFAINASLPVFSGGSRFAEQRQARLVTDQLQTERRAAEQLIEQSIRSTLHLYGAAYASVGFSEAAAEASRKNLDLVIDAYQNGTVSILDLLDAQNAALVAELVAANARYDHITKYFEVQRAVSSFDIFMTEAELDDFFQRLDAFFQQAAQE